MKNTMIEKFTNAEIISPRIKPKTPAEVYINKLQKETSRKVQRYDLDTLARRLGAMDDFSFARPDPEDRDTLMDADTFRWEALRYENTTLLQTLLLQFYKPRTAARIMCAVRGVLKSARRLHLMSAEDYEEAVDLDSIKLGKSVTGRALIFEEIAALLKTCRTGPPLRGVRDAAIIILMAGCGLRENEVTRASLSDYNQKTGELLVHGKGGGKDGKLRPAYLTNGTRDAMDIWLSKRGDQPGPLFTTIFKSDELTLNKMSNQSLYQMLLARGEKARVERFTPHDLRRTFITIMSKMTDLKTLADLVGHEKIETTASYIRFDKQHSIEAAGLLSIPFTPRED
jgi:integrase